MQTGIDGLLVGHWTDPVAKTGCTAVVFPAGSVASGEVRGGAPATREFALLDPLRSVETVDALVLSGGSAFGLAAADGVMAGLEAQGRGFPTSAGRVPIVVGLSLFDLGVGDPTVRPGADQGRTAFDAAGADFATGMVGAGAGATVDKWSGSPRAGGLVASSVEVETEAGTATFTAIVAVNAFCAVESHGAGFAGNAGTIAGPKADLAFGENTTIGVVVTNLSLDKLGAHRLAQAAHNGLARSLCVAHTPVDGDAIVAVGTGSLPGIAVDQLTARVAVQTVVEQAVRSLN